MRALQTVKGMHDILPDDMPKWHFVENLFKKISVQYGFEEIRTPVVEPLELFIRGIGETTDIVEKEMYTFIDKGDAHLSLRPEGTASVIRSYLQHNLGAQTSVLRVCYLGPMFRRERPAKGRYRQFYQAGAELIGASEPASDAEIIDFAVFFVKSLGIKEISVQINSLGDSDTRPKYKQALIDFFSNKRDKLCSDCNRRLELNPLRVLDCKVSCCIEARENAPSILEFLNDEAKEHFDELQKLLKIYDINFNVVPTMVRGLDYYTRTIFEIQGTSDLLGSQSTIVGGGRYNNLVKELGGKSVPTIGFAFGIERLLIMLGDNIGIDNVKKIFVAGVGDGDFERTIKISNMLRKAGLNVEAPYKMGSLRAQLKRASKSGAMFSVIAGEDEASKNEVTLKNMLTGEQVSVSIDSLADKIRSQM